MQSIVVATTPNSPWLADCLASIGVPDYPLLILSDFSWEMGKIRFIMEHTDISEFFFVQDTSIIKDTSIFKLAFDYPHSFAMSNQFKMFIGKYQRRYVEQCEIWTPTNKKESVLSESNFHWEYLRADPDTQICDNPLDDPPESEWVIEDKNGRRNLVVENQYIKKWKSTWLWEHVA